jgi:hypothetical protein
MEDAEYAQLTSLLHNFINDDVRKAANDPFACSFQAAGSTGVRKNFQQSACGTHGLRRCRISFPQIFLYGTDLQACAP